MISTRFLTGCLLAGALLATTLAIWLDGRRAILSRINAHVGRSVDYVDSEFRLALVELAQEDNFIKMRSWGLNHALNQRLSTQIRSGRLDRVVLATGNCEIWADTNPTKTPHTLPCIDGRLQTGTDWRFEAKKGNIRWSLQPLSSANKADLFLYAEKLISDEWLNHNIEQLSNKEPDSSLSGSNLSFFHQPGALPQSITSGNYVISFFVGTWWTHIVPQAFLIHNFLIFSCLLTFLLGAFLCLIHAHILTIRAASKSGLVLEALREGKPTHLDGMVEIAVSVTQLRQVALDIGLSLKKNRQELDSSQRNHNELEARLELSQLELRQARATQNRQVARNGLIDMVEQNGHFLRQYFVQHEQHITKFHKQMRLGVIEDSQKLHQIGTRWRSEIAERGPKRFIKSLTQQASSQSGEWTQLEKDMNSIVSLSARLTEQTIHTALFLDQLRLGGIGQLPVVEHWLMLAGQGLDLEANSAGSQTQQNLNNYITAAEKLLLAHIPNDLQISVKTNKSQAPEHISGPVWITGCYYILRIAAESSRSQTDRIVEVSQDQTGESESLAFSLQGAFTTNEFCVRMFKCAEKLFREFSTRCEVMVHGEGHYSIVLSWSRT